MLRLNSSGTASQLASGGNPVPCIQCDRRETGLSWGDFCSVCRRERARRADRLAQRWAILAAAALAAWLLFWRTPVHSAQRIFAAASVLLVYLVIRRLVSRVLQELMPKEMKR
ncbi:MAG: hypothetical protein KF785_12925 [Gemmatimonadales bacterium]|nr:hypothetical protein [Gemmatimonadales bacterium]